MPKKGPHHSDRSKRLSQNRQHRILRYHGTTWTGREKEKWGKICIKEALTSTCQEVLGLKKYHHKEWISTETLDKIKERKNKKAAINNSRTRAEKVQAQAEYIEANKQVKRSIRADKKKYVEELATTAEKAAREVNMKQLHDTTKKLSGKYSKPERPSKDKEGRQITEIQQQRNRWGTAWVGEPYGTLYDTVLYLRKSATSCEIHMTD
ncbi:unnamed protein product [Schistosoma margrebowiei]|uniref:Uncharacterized protein n=1 Tax=Schistosoma margrebowiei TaxID=48269 RepID=A0A183MW25_9TREM|nr:unnamed protein product [Schistosoma margrebowiei]